MTTEDKELLLRDLVARLPYGVIGQALGGRDDTISVFVPGEYPWVRTTTGLVCHLGNGQFKPYLRPMSSMTEEEHGRYMEFIEWSYNDYNGTTTTCIDKERLHEYLNFIYSHHLDDNNFIEKGLALEAKEGMYKSE